VSNIKLVLEYDGSFFHGFQIQPKKVTVQSALLEALELVLCQKALRFYGAGRTDAGVHARGQVVNFQVEGEPDLRRLSASLNGLLSGKISVLQAQFVPHDFNARRDAVAKQYSYYILNQAAPPVLERGRVWHVRAKLNLDQMQQEAQAIVGKHNFLSLAAKDSKARSPLREIFSSEIIQQGSLIIYRVVGRSFLKQMVRNIVGTLVDIGRGKLAACSMAGILAKQDRRAAGVTAPAYGLFLDWVKY
jgi:tRNA pseudouridine38-40 synthase